jgi:RNA recognition motif-containing protein
MARLYVGNLAWETTPDKLKSTLEQDGRTVTAIDLKIDKRTGKPRGFAFVDMGSDEEAEAAIRELHGTTLDGREIKVNGAKPQRRQDGDDWGGRGTGGGGRRRR